jgi:DNA-binding SARP family transcriptional activator/tetratricopeptide (TPR) repeat protein
LFGVVEIRFLGVPSLQFEAQPPFELERHDAVLLALVAVEGQQGRASVAALLWPDADARRALTNLRQRLYRLRRQAGPILIDDDGPLRLQLQVRHDLEPGRMLQHARLSLAQPLEPWAFDDGSAMSLRMSLLRERWMQTRERALERQADELEAAGDLGAAIEVAEWLQSLCPTSEHVLRRCMRLHYFRGDRGRALSVWDAGRRRLREHLDIEPDEQTRALAALIQTGALDGRPPLRPVDNVALRRPARLAGRQHEWSVLDSALTEGVSVLMRGDRGIGKSRLAQAFSHRAGSSLTVSARASDELLPLAYLGRLVAALRAVDVTRPAAAQALLLAAAEGRPLTEQAALAQAADADLPAPALLREALAQTLTPWQQRPRSLLVLDDLHWADPHSLSLLLAWIDARTEARPMVLMCLREGAEPLVLQRWRAGRDSRDGGQLIELTLGPLDAHGTEELLTDLGWPGMAEGEREQALMALMHQTAGHPHLMLELLRERPRGWRKASIDIHLPATQRVAAMLGRRLRRLPADVQALGRVLALCGPDASIPLAAQVLGCGQEEVAAAAHGLRSAGLMQDDGQLFDAVREELCASTPAALTLALHARIARWMQNTGARLDAVALHWRAAGLWHEAGQAFEQAARARRDVHAHADELPMWDAAADCQARAGLGQQAGASQREALRAALVVESSVALNRRLDALMAGQPDEALQMAVLLARARARLNAAEFAGAREPAALALALARRRNDAASACAAASWLGLAQVLDGEAAAGLAQLREPGLLPSAADEATRSLHAGALGYALFHLGEYEAASQALTDAAALAERAGELGDASEHAGNLATCLNAMGQHPQSLLEAQRALRLWRRFGEPGSVSAAALQTQFAPLLAGEGRVGEALEMLTSACSTFRQLGPPVWQTLAEQRLAQLYLRLGQPARARQTLSPLPPEADARQCLTRERSLCRIDGLAGEAALQWLQQARSRHAGVIAAIDERSLALHRAAHESPVEALALADAVARTARADGDPPGWAHALVRGALACLELGQTEAARSRLQPAWSAVQAHGVLDLDRTTACLWLHRVAAATGEQSLADELLQAALSWLAMAWPQVPAAFRESFTLRNRVHRELLALGAARGWIEDTTRPWPIPETPGVA